MADKNVPSNERIGPIRKTKDMLFIPKEQWEKPNGVNRPIAHQVNAAEAMRIARTYAENKFEQTLILRDLFGRYPNMSPDASVAFSRLGLNADSPAVANAAHYDTLAKQVQGYDGYKAASYADVATALDALDVKPDKADIKDHNDARWFSGFKNVTRLLTAGLFAPLQAVTQYARVYARNIEQAKEGNRDWFTALAPTSPLLNKSLYENTIAYQMVMNDKDAGQGYFPGYKSDAVVASEQVAKDTLLIKGTNDMAWTLGRGISDIFFDPEDKAFKTMSGIIDATIALVADPTIASAKVLQARKLSKLSDAAVAATKSSRTAMTDAGFVDRLSKRQEQAQRLLEESDKYLADMKSSVINDLISIHEGAVASKGTMPMDEAIALGEKLGVPKLQKDYAKATADLKLLQDAAAASDPVAAAKAAGIRFKAGATNDEIAKSLRRRIAEKRREVKWTGDSLTDILGRQIYGDDLIAEKALLDEAKTRYLSDEGYSKRIEAQMADAEEARKVVEAHRAGLKVTPADARLERQKAVEWFAGPRAQFFLESIADIDNAAEINRLTKGRFGAELSHDLAMAKTVEEVEDVLLPLLGIKVDTLMPATTLGRYLVNAHPTLVMRGANSERLNAAYDKLNKVFGHPMQRMPNGRYVHFEDTEGLTEQVSRWMASARFSQDEIDDVFNRLAATDAADIVSRRRIVLDTLDQTLVRIADDAGVSAKSKQRLREDLTAYDNALYNEGQYHSRKVGETSGFDVPISATETVSLRGVPTSAAQLAHGIRLPDVQEIRRATGRVARMARVLDKRVGEGTMTEDVARNIMRGFRGVNNFFKTSMLVFRPAFVARDIMECMIRQYLSGGRTIISNPREMLATIITNPVAARKLLSKANLKSLEKVDPYKVDVNGNSFNSLNYSPGIDQEFMNSFTQMMNQRAISSDARVLTQGIRANGEWTMISLNKDLANASQFAEDLASVILRHYADPIHRLIAKGPAGLPEKLRNQVTKGKMTFEDAVSRMVAENRFAGVDMLRSSSDSMRRVLSTHKGRQEFLFNNANSVRNQIEHNIAGMKTLQDFIAEGKIVDDAGNVLFEVGQDFAKNHRYLTKMIKDQLVKNDDFAKAAQQIEIPSMARNMSKQEGLRKLVDDFFEVAARSTSRVIYSPEYRVKYWDKVSELAPLMSRSTAQKLLGSSFAKEIKDTKVVSIAEDGTRTEVNYAKHNPAFNQVVDAANGKYTDGFLSVDEVNTIASEAAAKHVANLFYDAAEKSNLVNAASLALPFVNAWQNTIRTWGKFSMDRYRLATRVVPAARLMQTLQSPSSRVIYDVTGTEAPYTDPTEGFIYSDRNGNKRFTVPFAGGLMTGFGMFGSTNMGSISTSLQSLNLAFSGGSLPGSDIGIAPGVGPLVSFFYQNTTPNSLKYALPPVIRDIVEPYGPKRSAAAIENFVPGWLKNYLFGADAQQVAKFSKGIMGWLVSTDPRYSAIWDQSTVMTAGQRAELQNELSNKAGSMAIGQIMWQSLIKAISPGAPIYDWYQKTKGGQSYAQIQLADAFNRIYEQVGGDYNLAFGEFTDVFGPEAVMSMMSTNTNEIVGTSQAYDFATHNSDLMNKYIKEIPYFFTGGDYSIHYASLLKARGEGKALSNNDLIREADAAMIASMRGQLMKKAVKYGYTPDWVDDQMANMKGHLFPGYEPLRPKTASDRNNRIARVVEMARDPRILETEAGKGLKQFLPVYMNIKQQAADAGYRSIAVDDFAAERQMLDDLANSIGKNNPDFSNLYKRVFYYDING